MHSCRSVLTLFASLALSAFPALAKDVPMKDQLFHYGAFPDISGESQRFAPGFEADDFHMMSSASDAVQRVRLVGDLWVDEHKPIQDWAASMDYAFARRGDRALILKNDWIQLVDVPRMTLLNEAPIRPFDRVAHVSGFVRLDSASEDVFALIDNATMEHWSIELHRIHPDLTMELVHNFPDNPFVIPLTDGFILLPKGPRPIRAATPIRLCHSDGKAHEGPLFKALNIIKDSGVVVSNRSLWATSLRRPWVLVRHDAAPDGPSSHMWVMTLADAAGHPRTSPLVFETRQNVHERVQELLLSPTHDLFLAVVGNTKQASRSGTLWLGRIVREGDLYRAIGYRVRSFDDIANMALSRDGSTLVFFSFRQGDWHVGGARMADIVADINRRYPEAKLSLDAMKAEMR